MANDNSTTTKFKVDISELKKAMQEAKRSIAVANSEFKAVSSSMDDWSKSTDGINAKLKQLDTTMGAQKTVLNSLEAQYEAVKAEQGENSKAADDLLIKINNQKAAINSTQKQIDKWTASLNDLESESGQAENAADGLGNSLEEAGKEAEDAEGGFTVLKATIADLAAKAISSAVGALKDFVAQAGEVDKAINGLEASTGATAEEMKQYESVMKDIYNANYGESYDDVADSMSKVLQTMGDLSDVDLKNITTNGLALRDTFGFEMTESMRAVNSLMKQFGISADEAYNLIAQGAQSGLNQNDDLLDVINEYSVQFKNSGYSANEMFNMLKNGADAGVWSVDKLGDAVKEMNIRFSDGTVAEALAENAKALGLSKKEVAALQTEYNKGGDSAQQAVGKMIDSILKVKDETMQYQLGVSVFGTMWEDLGAEAIKALMSTKGELNSTKKTMDEIKNTKYDDLGGSLQQLGRMFKDEILTPVAEHIMPKLQEFVTYCIENFASIKQSVIDAGNAFMEWLPTLATIGAAIAAYMIATKIMAFVEAIKAGTVALQLMSAAQGVLNAVMSLNPIGLVIAAIAALVVAFVTLWNKSETFRNFWIGLWENIKSATKTVVDSIGNFFTKTLPDFFNGLINWIKGNWKNLLLILINPFAGLFKYFYENNTKFKEFVDNAIRFIKELPSKIGYWLGYAIGTVAKWIVNMATKAAEAGSKFLSSVINFIKQLPSNIATWLVNALTKVAAWASNLAEKGKEAAKSLKDAVVNGVKELPSKMLEIGKNIVTGVWNGIKSMKDTITKNVKKFFTGIVDGAKDALGIHSPSRVFRDQVGAQIAEGVIVGIKSKYKKAKKTAAQLATLTYEAAKERLDTQKKYSSISLANELSYWKKIVNSTKKGTQGYKDALLEYKTVRDSLNEQIKKAEDDYATKVSEVKSKLISDIQAVTDKYDDAVKSRANSIVSSMGLFDAFSSTTEKSAEDLLNNLESQVNGIYEWDEALRTLSGRGVSDGLVTQLQEMGVSALADIKTLVAMTDEELTKYVALWDIKNQLATDRAVEEYKELREQSQIEIQKLIQTANKDLNDLEKDYKNSLLELGVAVADTSVNIGKGIVQSLKKGIESQREELMSYLKSLFASITATAKSSLNLTGAISGSDLGSTLNSVNTSGVSSTLSGLTSAASSTTREIGGTTVINNYEQTINSPQALTRLEIYRQSKNLLAFNGGA